MQASGLGSFQERYPEESGLIDLGPRLFPTRDGAPDPSPGTLPLLQ